MNEHFVAIIMPAKNAEKYIKETIISILSQSHKNFELICVDDGSNDSTGAVINEFIEFDNRVRYVRTEGVGISKALNLAIGMTAARFIARMDADDICHSNRIEIQIKYLLKNKHISVVGSNIEYFGDRSGVSNFPISRAECMTQLFFAPCCAHPTYMFDRSRMNPDEFYYFPGDNVAQDWELLTRISKDHGIKNIKKVLLKYRIHKNQISKNFEIKKNRVIDIALNYWLRNGFILNNRDVEIILWPEFFWREAKLEERKRVKKIINNWISCCYKNNNFSFKIALIFYVKFKIKALLS